MKNLFFFKNHFYVLIILLLLIVMIGCWEFLSIDQPVLADPNSSFEVPITVALTSDEGSGEGYFGILLPVGWNVEDSIEYSGIHNGTFVYSHVASDNMENIENAPDGYYWWFSVSDTVDSLLEGTISFTPRIHTNDQSGTFFIDYIMTDRFEDQNLSDYMKRSENHPISVDAPTALTVKNTNNSGEGSLRKALSDISMMGEITFDLTYPATIILDSQLVINRSVTISGPLVNGVTISGNNTDRVFYIKERISVDMSNLSIVNGLLPFENNDARGGGIYSSADSLNLKNVNIVGNSARYGGGIYSGGSYLNLENVMIDTNTAFWGGGIDCNEDVKLNNVNILNNTAQWDGERMARGGGMNCRGNITILNSKIVNNTGNGGNGGGIYFGGGSLYLSNVRISNNNAATGGAIYFDVIYFDGDSIFSSQNLCNIYLNGSNEEFFCYGDENIHVIVDTFTVLQPTDQHAFPFDNFTFDILHDISGNPNKIENRVIKSPEFALSNNYPNPFNPSTIIDFELPKASDVRIDVYNIAGQKIQTLVNENMSAGSHQVEFNAQNISSGVYFYRIEAGKFQDVKKMILLR